MPALNPRPAPAAIVFDFDGTLVDSMAGLLAATNRVLVEEKRRPLTLTELQPMLGGGAPMLVERAFRLTGAPLHGAAGVVDRWQAHYRRFAPECTALYPGVAALLSTVARQGLSMGVCTGKPQASALALCSALGIGGFFASVKGRDSTPTPKPHPGHLLAVLADLHVEPARAVMVGDSEQDMCMARAAGVRSVYITHGESFAHGHAPGCDWTVECPGQLQPALAEFVRTLEPRRLTSG